MPNQQLLDTINKHPELTSYGMGVPASVTFADARLELGRLSEEFQYCRAYLATKKKRSTINKKAYSYWGKHDVEKWIEVAYSTHVYISEGAFVAAALSLEFQYEICPTRTGVCLNIANP